MSTAPDCLETGGDRRDLLKPKQRRAVKLIAQGLTYRSVAKEVGCGVTTIALWRKTNPAFNAAVEQELLAFEEEADATLRSSLPFAMHNVRRLMQCGNDSVELGASRTVMEGWEKLLRARQLEQKIADLEARLEAAVARAEAVAALSPDPLRNDPDDAV